MPAYAGAGGSFTPVPSPQTGVVMQKGESQYVVGKLAASATQLPVNDLNVATENFAGASMSVDIQSAEEAAPAPGVFVEIHYASAPGAGESVAIQEADTDADGFYITPSNAAYTMAITSGTVIRSDLIPTGGKFLRANRTVGANAVGCTIKLTRAS